VRINIAHVNEATAVPASSQKPSRITISAEHFPRETVPAHQANRFYMQTHAVRAMISSKSEPMAKKNAQDQRDQPELIERLFRRQNDPVILAAVQLHSSSIDSHTMWDWEIDTTSDPTKRARPRTSSAQPRPMINAA